MQVCHLSLKHQGRTSPTMQRDDLQSVRISSNSLCPELCSQAEGSADRLCFAVQSDQLFSSGAHQGMLHHEGTHLSSQHPFYQLHAGMKRPREDGQDFQGPPSVGYLHGDGGEGPSSQQHHPPKGTVWLLLLLLPGELLYQSNT